MNNKNKELLLKTVIIIGLILLILTMIFAGLSEYTVKDLEKQNFYTNAMLLFGSMLCLTCIFMYYLMGKVKITYKNLEWEYEKVIKEISFNGINGSIKIKYIEPDEFNPDKFSTLLMNKIYIKNNGVNIDGDIVFNRIDLKRIQKIINKVIKKNMKRYNYIINTTLRITISSKEKDFITLSGEYAGLYGFAYDKPATSFSIMMNLEQINDALNDIQKYIDAND